MGWACCSTRGAKAFEIWTARAFPIALIRARLLEAHRAADQGSAAEGVTRGWLLRLGELFLQRPDYQSATRSSHCPAEVEGSRLRHHPDKTRLGQGRDVSRCLGEQYGIPYIDLDSQTIPPEVIRLIPLGIVQKHLVIPVAKLGPR